MRVNDGLEIFPGMSTMADVRFKTCLYTTVGFFACPIQRIQISEHTDPLMHRFIE